MVPHFLDNILHIVPHIKRYSAFKKELKNYPNVQNAYAVYKKRKWVDRLDFLQFLIQKHSSLDQPLNEVDFDFVIAHANLKYKNRRGIDTFTVSLLSSEYTSVSLNASHFKTLAKGANYTVSDREGIADISLALSALFVNSQKSEFMPSASEISLLLASLVKHKKKYKNDEFNPLLCALYYQKIGKTPLQLEHYDYLFNQYNFDLEPVKFREETCLIIMNKKAEYDTIKQKNYLAEKIQAIESSHDNTQSKTGLATSHKIKTHKI